MVSNGLGIAVSVALIGYVLLRASSGLQVDVELPAFGWYRRLGVVQ